MHITTYYNVLQRITTYYNVLQRITMYYNIMHHTCNIKHQHSIIQ